MCSVRIVRIPAFVGWVKGISRVRANIPRRCVVELCGDNASGGDRSNYSGDRLDEPRVADNVVRVYVRDPLLCEVKDYQTRRRCKRHS